MIAAQAAANGAELLDWYTASIGHDACKPPVIRWVEPVVPRERRRSGPPEPRRDDRRERARRPRSGRPRAAHLVDRREAGLEAAPRGPQVEPPDAHPLRRRPAASPRRGCSSSRARPVPQRLRVVVAEALDVVGLEPGALERELDARQVQRRGVGEHVALRERRRPRARRRRRRAIPWLSSASARLHAAARAGARTRRSGSTPTCSTMPMLGDRVEAARRRARGSPARGSRPGRRGPRSATRSRAELGLRLGQRDADHLDAVALGGVDREAAPAAADVEHALALLQAELGADQLELGLLRLLERRRAAREDRAAVGHRLAEEQREELVRDVVVVAHRARVALAACGAGRASRSSARGDARRAPQAAARAAASASRACSPRARAAGGCQPSSSVEHGVEVVDVELARDVGAAEPELARRAQRVGERVAASAPEGGPAAVRRGQRRAVPEPTANGRSGSACSSSRRRGCGRDSIAREGTVRAMPDYSDLSAVYINCTLKRSPERVAHRRASPTARSGSWRRNGVARRGDPRGRPRHRHRRVAGHDRARLGARRVAGDLRAR